jgi:hypothetical protein
MMRLWYVLCGCSLVSSSLFAQDNDYYTSYDDKLTGRFYFSQKYTSFRYHNRENDIRLNYFPNTTLNMGVGATNKWATLNLAYGFGFLNPDKQKNETEYLDLQCHIYRKTVVIDLLGQFYNGFHLNNDDLRDNKGNKYSRSDIKVREVGASVQYVTNHDKFSYRAGFLQNDWQKRSAGTWLFGWQMLGGNGDADSTIIPSKVSNIPSEAQPQKLAFFETGPSVGYAYSLVIRENFFLMASATIVFSYEYSRLEGLEISKSSSFIPNGMVSTAAGYNSALWAVTASWTNSTVNVGADSNDQIFSLHTGNLRLNFVRRFKLKRPLL